MEGGWLEKSLFIAVIILAPPGCARRGGTASTAPTLAADSAQPEQGVSEGRWRQFLDREVTPRFPDGLSVVDLYGQWQGKGDTAPERLRSKMLLIAYPDKEENRAKVEALRAAWKRMTGDQSVMRLTAPLDVSF